jgi:transposase-like protein
MEFLERFPDDDACLDYLWRTRYATEDGSHAQCPHCEEVREFKHYNGKQQRQAWTCVACGHYLYPTAGTIFHKSSTALHLWFYAMYIMASTRCGVSAKQLERELGVTYKTAWRMFTLIRNQLMAQDEVVVLNGPVEVDETFVGGKPRQSDRAKIAHLSENERRSALRAQAWKEKTPVWGVVERGGKVAAHVVASTQWRTLKPYVQAYIAPRATVYTDKATTYRWMTGYNHQSVDHFARVYVSGDIHTQTIEGFWSLVKRGISGSHHAVSRKWLQGYLNEYVWRYNHRDDPRSMFELLLLRSAYPAET